MPQAATRRLAEHGFAGTALEDVAPGVQAGLWLALLGLPALPGCGGRRSVHARNGG
ncbi:hypothetical protein ACU635_35545 [[Actinomadura] parvosata]|uniref:hypothetical protein n=1 Tax=[Actinomadura] parvosata TaxID=1955412 RepID=UPI00406CF58C